MPNESGLLDLRIRSASRLRQRVSAPLSTAAAPSTSARGAPSRSSSILANSTSSDSPSAGRSDRTSRSCTRLATSERSRPSRERSSFSDRRDDWCWLSRPCVTSPPSASPPSASKCVGPPPHSAIFLSAERTVFCTLLSCALSLLAARRGVVPTATEETFRLTGDGEAGTVGRRGTSSRDLSPPPRDPPPSKNAIALASTTCSRAFSDGTSSLPSDSSRGRRGTSPLPPPSAASISPLPARQASTAPRSGTAACSGDSPARNDSPSPAPPMSEPSAESFGRIGDPRLLSTLLSNGAVDTDLSVDSEKKLPDRRSCMRRRARHAARLLVGAPAEIRATEAGTEAGSSASPPASAASTAGDVPRGVLGTRFPCPPDGAVSKFDCGVAPLVLRFARH